MSKLISFLRLGENRGAPRLWIEGGRLERLGFRPGMPVDCVAGPGGGLTLLASALGANRVSQRRAAGGVRPIIDINSAALLGGLAEFGDLKVTGSCCRIDVQPSARAFAVARHRARVGPLRVLDCFAGGGTLSAARVAVSLELHALFVGR